MKRVGFIVGNQLHQIRWLHPDRITGGDFDRMRFGWVAEEVNQRRAGSLRYELYRPWHRYDAVVFVKAMGDRERRLRESLRRRGTRVVFDANVNYYEREGSFYYDGMAPTDQQVSEAVEMTGACDAVIADSRFIAGRCRRLQGRVAWIPDNVNLRLVPDEVVRLPTDPDRIDLLWCGQAMKLFELLAVEDSLRLFRKRIRLVLIANSRTALERWSPDVRQRFDRLLADVEHEFHPYVSVEALLAFYAARPGVFLSPRFLDNSYNLGHTEWKITLPMACRRWVLASPVPSYGDVAERSGGRGLRICATQEDWNRALEAAVAGAVDWDAEGEAASRVVAEHYATDVVAAEHARFLWNVMEGAEP